MARLQRLWVEEGGFIVSAELVLVATVVVIGMLVGLVTIRDQVIQELADVADAISEVDQSYSFTGIVGHASSTSGTIFNDTNDYCEQAAGSDQQTGPQGEPQCLDIEGIDPAIMGGGEGPGV